jgi:tetratricopeptide (TPR) repeat protein
MPSARPIVASLAIALAILSLTSDGSPPSAAAAQPLGVTADVSYDIRPEDGPVHVSWQVQLVNNDPQTSDDGEGGVITFYNAITLPVLRGATGLSAVSPSDSPLNVTLDDSLEGPVVVATVEFDRRIFFQDTYAFSLDYDLADTRDRSLLITPSYVFLPAIATGEEATVRILTPDDDAWEVSLEPVDCERDGSTFACSGPSSVHVAAFAEVSRPDATSSIPIDLTLGGGPVSITLTHFQGEEAWAQHLQDLVTQSLPVIEDLYGFAYSGPAVIEITERGRNLTLGYEGLASCEPQTSCQIGVSPLADDFTVLHELAHLWSDIYAERWLVEGVAEFIAGEAAALLPSDLVRGEPLSSVHSILNLPLDDWGEVTSIVGADDDQLAREAAGYDRSHRFLLALKSGLGLEVLQNTNAALHQNGSAADSALFMDTIEDVSGRNLDRLFAGWVFPESFAPTLEARREARERLAELATRVADADALSADILDPIRDYVTAWRFEDALAALDNADVALQTYADFLPALADLRRGVDAAGLALPSSVDDAIRRWDFNEAIAEVTEAGRALNAYVIAKQTVDSSRDPWQRFGLLGSDPDADLATAADAFAQGDYDSAIEDARRAADTIDDASRVALSRALIIVGVVFAAALLVAISLVLYNRRSHHAIPR